MNLKLLLARIAATAAVTAAAVAAQAATYQFTLTGGYAATWQLQSTLVPDDPYEGEGFIIWDVVGDFPGAETGVVDLLYFHADTGGGLVIEDFYGNRNLLVTDGPQLYTGSELNPSFLLGTFTLSDSLGSGTYTLTVTDVSAVPEPASAALLLAGLSGVGAASVRRRRAACAEVG